MGVPLRKNVQFQLLWLGGAVSGRMDAVLNFAARALTPLAPVLGADLVGGAAALLACGALILVTAVVAVFTDLKTPVVQPS
ncbi:hypothetical protein ACFOWZ_06215 [Lentzea rhizosphaerae]|uniref:MFS transporter n=1 Tax=Lentzea rhizosphaerae TaxID=2041025 RepID=A0ABV8BNP1_9PSEU